MTEFVWRLPSRGDGRRAEPTRRNRGGFGPVVPIADATDVRPGNFGPFDHLDQVVSAAELSGLDGVLAPYDPLGEESWIVAASALRATRHVRVVVEFQPAFGTPVYAAKLSATLQRISGGRLSWRLRVDTDAADAAARGDRVRSRDRYRRAGEFLTVARGVWNETPQPGAGFAGGTGFDFAGQYFDVADGGFRGILSGLPFPTVHTAGDSDDALELAAHHGDVHVFTETAAGVGEAVERLRDRTAATGRNVQAGLELPVIARETESEAWDRVRRQWSQAGEPGAVEPLAFGDGRWAGFDRLGYDQPIGLVGSYEQVAGLLADYAGINVLVLTGHPHIEELHRTGEHLLHLVDPAGRTLAEQGATA